MIFKKKKKKALEPARREAMKGVSVLLRADLALSVPPFTECCLFAETRWGQKKKRVCVKATQCSAQELANRVTDKSRFQG